MAMSGTTATRPARRMVRKKDAKIVFVLRDGKYYLAEFWCVSDFCCAIAVIKKHLREFLVRRGFKCGPVEVYGEMELLRLLDRFVDRALCFATAL
jgi:hypothetical protein